MSCVGIVIGPPCAGDRILLDESISVDASICASGDSGMWTAIWSPSKSALNAVQVSGCSLMALPSTSTGSNAWMPRRCSVGARFKRMVILDDFFKNVPNYGVLLLDQFFRLFDGRAMAALLQAMVDERLEQLERHLLRKTALVKLQLRPD